VAKAARPSWSSTHTSPCTCTHARDGAQILTQGSTTGMITVFVCRALATLVSLLQDTAG
jgi:hypothetical protein